jgi:hypothetical protein
LREFARLDQGLDQTCVPDDAGGQSRRQAKSVADAPKLGAWVLAARPITIDQHQPVVRWR